MERVDALVVGGGSAGLSASHELARHGIDHLVLERGRIGQSWHDRWDSFCLVTPNWTVRLPGHPYDGPEPNGFMARDAIAAHLERYAAGFGAPVRAGVGVRTVERTDGGFIARTTSGDVRSKVLIAASGTYGRPHRPPEATALPPGLLAMDLPDYRRPDALPSGRVLVVGSGQSGCQVAEELHEAGRDVVLSCGRAPWVRRRVGGQDIFWWLDQTGFLRQPASTLPSPAARLLSNPLASGHGGGHDLHLRTLAALGVTLVGRFRGVEAGSVAFDDDLAASVAWGDARHAEVMASIRNTATRLGLPDPGDDDAAPFRVEAPTRLPLQDVGTVVFTGGFRPDYGSWLPWPEAFDEQGFPRQADGASLAVDGLYFLGSLYMRTRGSAILIGVGEDAQIVGHLVAERLRAVVPDA
jgi:putative flavoprotein involved in K+ transport